MHTYIPIESSPKTLPTYQDFLPVYSTLSLHHLNTPPKMPSRPIISTPLTHFLCLPLLTDSSRPQLQSSLQQLAADIHRAGLLDALSNADKVVRPLGTLHLTIGMMSLPQPTQLERAARLLRELDLRGMMREVEEEEGAAAAAAADEDAAAAAAATAGAGAAVPPPAEESNPKEQQAGSRASAAIAPYAISLTSLKSMTAPAKAAVLYAAPIDRSGRLLPLCLRLRGVFEAAGLVVPEQRPLLLHATLLNMVYGRLALEARGGEGSSGKGGRGKGRKGRPRTIDARDLIGKYDGFVFAEGVRLEKVAICKMGAKEVVDSDGRVVGAEYEIIAERELDYGAVANVVTQDQPPA